MTQYDALFLKAVSLVLKHEGSEVVDDPRDPGQLTHFGFALRDNPDLTADEIRAMTEEQAVARYFTRWWLPYRWAHLPQGIACKCFDCAVPMGPQDAIRALQRACWAAGRKVAEDGVLGPETVGAAGYVSTPVLLAALKSELAAHFRLVAASRPQMSKYLNGWLQRSYSD